jgi:isopentenyl diphosphate isomerase/L-lactate dehydrogenase-like FMN-dependent dehydrogenase
MAPLTAQLTNVHEYEARAKVILPRPIYDYFAGGAGDETTLESNKASFRAIRFRPRVLLPVGHVNTSLAVSKFRDALDIREPFTNGSFAPTSQFGMPVIIAPMAMQKMACELGEIAAVRAAKSMAVPFCLSTLSTTSIEDVAEQGGVFLFQLYVHKQRSETLKLVRRAKSAGYAALVLTVDAPKFGRRERDLRNGFALLPHIRLENFTGTAGHDTIAEGELGVSALQRFGEDIIDADLSWADLAWLVREAQMPVWVKGILHGDDADRAIDHGAAAIVVSNHGARQLDGTISAIDALPDVVVAVQNRVPIILDSGVRRGEDCVKAMALGATAVMIGRPILWGLAVDGQQGVENVLSLMKSEISLTMSLLGARNIDEITRDHVIFNQHCPSSNGNLISKL